MNNTVFDRTKVIKYLIWTFGLAYAIQIGVWLLYKNGLSLIGSLVMAAMMFVPMLGVLLSGSKLSGMGWNPRIKKNIKPILIAWFAPAVLTAVGAVLYFLIFPTQLPYLCSPAERSPRAGRRDRLERLSVSSAQGEIRQKHRLAARRRHLGRMARAADLADRLRVRDRLLRLSHSRDTAVLRVHDRDGHDLRPAVRKEREHLDAVDMPRSRQRRGDPAACIMPVGYRLRKTAGTRAQRTYRRHTVFGGGGHHHAPQQESRLGLIYHLS